MQIDLFAWAKSRGGKKMACDKELDDLRYEINRETVELNNLKKTIQVKKKTKMLDAFQEMELNRQVQEKEAGIRRLEAQIRKIENARAREENFSGKRQWSA